MCEFFFEQKYLPRGGARAFRENHNVAFFDTFDRVVDGIPGAP